MLIEKKKRINSKKKGNLFELEISKLLTEVTDSKWYRVGVASGGRATREGITINGFSGDVFTEDETYKDMVIECKSYAGLEINDLFNEKSKFHDWIRQSIKESEGKRWVLFIKINRKGIFMLADGLNLISTCFIPGHKVILVNKRMFIKLK